MVRADEEVAALLWEYADLTAISGDGGFRVRVHEKAARPVRRYAGDVAALDMSVLTAIPKVGASIAAKIEEYMRTVATPEIDVFPNRLNLSAENIRRARGYGVSFAIDSAAHAVPHPAKIRYSTRTAQHGWVSQDEVINTWPLDRLTSFLSRER